MPQSFLKVSWISRDLIEFEMSWEPRKLAEALEGLAMKMKSSVNDRRVDEGGGGGERKDSMTVAYSWNPYEEKGSATHTGKLISRERESNSEVKATKEGIDMKHWRMNREMSGKY